MDRKFKIGDKYMLIHKYNFSQREYDFVIKEFTLVAFRGSKLYFFNEEKGIDKIISRHEFEKLHEEAKESSKDFKFKNKK